MNTPEVRNLIENRLLSSVYRCKGFSLKFIEHHFRGFRNQTTDERSSDKLDKEASGRTVHPQASPMKLATRHSLERKASRHGSSGKRLIGYEVRYLATHRCLAVWFELNSLRSYPFASRSHTYAGRLTKASFVPYRVA